LLNVKLVGASRDQKTLNVKTVRISVTYCLSHFKSLRISHVLFTNCRKLKGRPSQCPITEYSFEESRQSVNCEVRSRERQTDRHTNTQNKSTDWPKYGGRFALTLCSSRLPFLFDVMSYAAVFFGRLLLSFLRNILSSFLYSVLP
jgi:hypothetical protein